MGLPYTPPIGQPQDFVSTRVILSVLKNLRLLELDMSFISLVLLFEIPEDTCSVGRIA